MRRLSVICPLLLLALARPVASQPAASAWPDRPVRVLVGYNPGIGPDLVSRLLVAQLQRRLGGVFVVENRPGASGMIAGEALARAAPDGTTLGAMVAAQLSLNQHLHRRVPYDSARDFRPIAELAALASLVVVNSASPVTSLAELPGWLRGQGDRITWRALASRCGGPAGQARRRPVTVSFAPASSASRHRPGRHRAAAGPPCGPECPTAS